MNLPHIPVMPRGLPSFAVRCPEPPVNDPMQRVKGSVFFHTLTDGGVAGCFLRAVAANPEDALPLVSKRSLGAIDLGALREVLACADDLCGPFAQVEYSRRGGRTCSVILMDGDRKAGCLLRLYLVREPDRYGQWKVCRVEQE